MIALPWAGREDIQGVREAKTDGGSVRSIVNLPKLQIFFHMKCEWGEGGAWYKYEEAANDP